MAKGYGRQAGGRKGMPGGGAGGGNMMNQLKAMQEQMEAVQAQVAQETVTASVGGGMLKITMTGDQVCQSVEINPEMLTDMDAEMLQDLLLSGINSALEQSKELSSSRMSSITGGIPGIG
ncbi:MAG: YbaB/EbfC family nucleoid-associated protein [Anaerolineaceae bacterium]|nr:YbaB/EbfC family nucleoid-associated protein [Anaerolineaceae bacterium]